MQSSSDDQKPNNAGPGQDRRTFLKAGALATGAMTLAGPLSARSGAGRRGGTKVTVVLFQRGGADHLNLYAPTGDPFYAQLRPTIGVLPPGSTGAVVGLPMSTTFSMHPAMTGLHARFTAPNSRLGIVHAVGYLPYNRSHFESQDLYETGLAPGSPPDGWINRHLQVTSTTQDPPVRALALRPTLPLSMAGSYPCFTVATMQDLTFIGQADMRVTLEAITDTTPTGAMHAQQQLAYQSGIDAFDLIDIFAGINPATYVPANGAVYPVNAIGQALKEVAEVIKANLGVEFYAVDHNGWDHHAGLVTAINNTATQLSQAINAFFTDLGTLGVDVVLVTMSEFGRIPAENGSGGTDHGVGGAMLVAGGAVNGGLVHGIWPGLSQQAMISGRFLAPSNDFRSVLREILEVHMGGTDPNIVFPGHVHAPIGIL
ncbi:MAG TPA: DUF1501 domain-containing protein [Planctomycetota bacterium]